MDNINSKIRALRKQRQLTLEEVASAIGMTKGNLSRLERGDISIAPERLDAIAAYFKVSREELESIDAGQRVVASKRQAQKEQQVQRIQQAVEQFIAELFSERYDEIEEENEDLSKDELTRRALDAVFRTPGMEHLLNGECTSADFPMLEPFKGYPELLARERKEKMQQQIQAFMKSSSASQQE